MERETCRNLKVNMSKFKLNNYTNSWYFYKRKIDQIKGQKYHLDKNSISFSVWKKKRVSFHDVPQSMLEE